LLSDPTGEICQAYGACDNLSSGRVRRNTYVIGPDGTILRMYQDVKPEDHAEEILAILGELSHLAYQEKLLTNGITMNLQKREEGKMNDHQRNETKNDQAHGTMRDELQEATHNTTHNRLPIPNADSIERPKIGREIASSSSVYIPNALQPGNIQSVAPSQACPAQNSGSLVFALGTLGYDFGSETRRDSLMQHMEGSDLLTYLDKEPSQAAAIIWTLNLDATPIYAIQPQGAFAGDVYKRLRQFLREQIDEGVERVSIPGTIFGQVRLMSNQIIPAIWPELRGMYSWTTAALVEAVCGKPPSESAKTQEQAAYAQKIEAVANFLRRVYDELRNLGITSQERAINYAATNVANANNIFELALEKKLELHNIEVVPSPTCRPGSDCWDVKLVFFDPENVLRTKTAYRFTVDVSDVCPVMVDQVRSWSMPQPVAVV
jgi:cyanobactin maturation PatA/PatG family protease